MINSRAQACNLLGVSAYASPEEIKNAYKALVKVYHPDAGKVVNTNYYTAIVEAYEYLKNNPITYQVNAGRILGQGKKSSASSFSYERGNEYAKFQKSYERQKQEKKEAFEERLRQDKYDRTMEAINAIRVAEAIKAMIRESEK